MAPKRAACSLSLVALVEIMRGTILSLEGEEWLKAEMSEVAEHYSGFLIACAGATTRLTASLVTAAAAELFGRAQDVKSFGQRLATCFSWCTERGRKAKTGERVSAQSSPELVRVLRAFGMAAAGSPGKTSPAGKGPGASAKQGTSSSSSSKLPNAPALQVASSGSSSSRPKQQKQQQQQQEQPASSSSKPRSRAEIFQAYGLLPPAKETQKAAEPQGSESKPVVSEGLVDLLSSQEPVASQESVVAVSEGSVLAASQESVLLVEEPPSRPGPPEQPQLAAAEGGGQG
jgi:hypothetical protein